MIDIPIFKVHYINCGGGGDFVANPYIESYVD